MLFIVHKSSKTIVANARSTNAIHNVIRIIVASKQIYNYTKSTRYDRIEAYSAVTLHGQVLDYRLLIVTVGMVC
jgi:hypothetical protein